METFWYRLTPVVVEIGRYMSIMLSSSCQVPLLETGDIIIDGGNSEYTDTTVFMSFTDRQLLFLTVVHNLEK